MKSWKCHNCVLTVSVILQHMSGSCSYKYVSFIQDMCKFINLKIQKTRPVCNSFQTCVSQPSWQLKWSQGISPQVWRKISNWQKSQNSELFLDGGKFPVSNIMDYTCYVQNIYSRQVSVCTGCVKLSTLWPAIAQSLFECLSISISSLFHWNKTSQCHHYAFVYVSPTHRT